MRKPPVDTFYVRYKVPHGWAPEQVAGIAVEDLKLAARHIGVRLRAAPRTRLIDDGGSPLVEAWAHMSPRVRPPAAPHFDNAPEYQRWREQQQEAAA